MVMISSLIIILLTAIRDGIFIVSNISFTDGVNSISSGTIGDGIHHCKFYFYLLKLLETAKIVLTIVFAVSNNH